MSLAAQACQIDPNPIVATLYGEGVGFALEVPVGGEDLTVGVPEVRAERDVSGMRKLRIQALGRCGATIPQRPAADLLGSTINSPPQPASFFFLPIYVHNSSASTHSTSSGGTCASTCPLTSSTTQFMTALWLTPTKRSVARKPTPSK